MRHLLYNFNSTFLTNSYKLFYSVFEQLFSMPKYSEAEIRLVRGYMAKHKKKGKTAAQIAAELRDAKIEPSLIKAAFTKQRNKSLSWVFWVILLIAVLLAIYLLVLGW